MFETQKRKLGSEGFWHRLGHAWNWFALGLGLYPNLPGFISMVPFWNLDCPPLEGPVLIKPLCFLSPEETLPRTS
jgi:hypothetical protein